MFSPHFLFLLAYVLSSAWGSEVQECSSDSANDVDDPVLLQSKYKRQSLPPLSPEELSGSVANGNRPAPSVEKEGERSKMFETTGTRLAVEANISDDGKFASVLFEYDGKLAHYVLNASSIYSDDASVVEHTRLGEQHLKLGPTRTFRSDIAGRRSWARLHEDGSTSGLFEHEGKVLQINPEGFAPLGLSLSTGASSMEQHDVSAHVVQRMVFDGRSASSAGEDDDYPIQDDAGLERPPTTRNAPHAQPFSSTDNWGGTKWFPGCYSGDTHLHEMSVGAIGDVLAWELYGDTLQGKIETAIALASYVWEQQMHITLKLGHLKIYKSADGAPAFAQTCQTESDFRQKLYDFGDYQSNLPYQANYAIFSGCYFPGSSTGYGWIGWPSDPAICSPCPDGAQDCKGCAVLSVPSWGSQMWLLYAHEFGHNFAALHSFEEGVGQTGGIMDYGAATVNGVVQFNTKYRRGDMCIALNTRVNNCQGKFVPVGGGITDPNTPRPTTTPKPTTAGPTADPLACNTCFHGGPPPGDGYCLVSDGTCQPTAVGACEGIGGYVCGADATVSPPTQAPTAVPTSPPTAAPTSLPSSTTMPPTTAAPAPTPTATTKPMQTQVPTEPPSVTCAPAPGTNAGATITNCAKCANGYKWWPCNTQPPICICSESSTVAPTPAPTPSTTRSSTLAPTSVAPPHTTPTLAPTSDPTPSTTRSSTPAPTTVSPPQSTTATTSAPTPSSPPPNVGGGKCCYWASDDQNTCGSCTSWAQSGSWCATGQRCSGCGGTWCGNA